MLKRRISYWIFWSSKASWNGSTKICLRKTSPSTGFFPESGNAKFRFQFPGNFKFSKNPAELALLDLRNSGPDATGFLSEKITEIVTSGIPVISVGNLTVGEQEKPQWLVFSQNLLNRQDGSLPSSVEATESFSSKNPTGSFL